MVNPFRRVTSQNFIAEVDGLRFIAIVPVVLMHATTGFLRSTSLHNEAEINQLSTFRKMVASGEVGVSIFFVISGFILAMPFAKHYILSEKPIHLGAYYLKRLTRLEPPYLATLTIFLLVHIFILSEQSFTDLLPHYLASIFYSHTIVFGYITPINPVAWSLEIEVMFYLLVPLFVLLFRIGSLKIRVWIYVLVILSYYLLIDPFIARYSVVNLTILGFYPYFFAGFIMAEIYLAKVYLQANLTRNFIVDIFGFVSLVLVFVVFEFYHEAHIMLPFLILIVFFSAFFGTYSNRFFSNPIVTSIGGMCYITYLIHYPTIYFLMYFFADVGLGQKFSVDVFIQWVTVVPIVFLISAVAFLVLEKPFMKRSWPSDFVRFVKSINRREATGKI